jgi:hypothetical protein
MPASGLKTAYRSSFERPSMMTSRYVIMASFKRIRRREGGLAQYLLGQVYIQRDQALIALNVYEAQRAVGAVLHA